MGPALGTRPAQHQRPAGTWSQPWRIEGHWRAQRRKLRTPRSLKNIQKHAALRSTHKARAWSASLSGWPSFTDSDVNRNVSCSAILPGALVVSAQAGTPRHVRHTALRFLANFARRESSGWELTNVVGAKHKMPQQLQALGPSAALFSTSQRFLYTPSPLLERLVASSAWFLNLHQCSLTLSTKFSNPPLAVVRQAATGVPWELAPHAAFTRVGCRRRAR